MGRRIIIRFINKPKKQRVKEEVRWICDSLGLMNGRDTDDISYKIMCELLELFSKEELIATDEIAHALKIEPPRVNHHIRCLMESGILLREKRKIALRGGSLSKAIEEMKRDSDTMFQRLLEVSKEIDTRFKL